MLKSRRQPSPLLYDNGSCPPSAPGPVDDSVSFWSSYSVVESLFADEPAPSVVTLGSSAPIHPRQLQQQPGGGGKKQQQQQQQQHPVGSPHHQRVVRGGRGAGGGGGYSSDGGVSYSWVVSQHQPPTSPQPQSPQQQRAHTGTNGFNKAYQQWGVLPDVSSPPVDQFQHVQYGPDPIPIHRPSYAHAVRSNGADFANGSAYYRMSPPSSPVQASSLASALHHYPAIGSPHHSNVGAWGISSPISSSPDDSSVVIDRRGVGVGGGLVRTASPKVSQHQQRGGAMIPPASPKSGMRSVNSIHTNNNNNNNNNNNSINNNNSGGNNNKICFVASNISPPQIPIELRTSTSSPISALAVGSPPISSVPPSAFANIARPLTFNSLPSQFMVHIFTYLSANDLASLQQVGKGRISLATTDDVLWKSLYLKRWRLVDPGEAALNSSTPSSTGPDSPKEGGDDDEEDSDEWAWICSLLQQNNRWKDVYRTRASADRWRVGNLKMFNGCWGFISQTPDPYTPTGGDPPLDIFFHRKDIAPDGDWYEDWWLKDTPGVSRSQKCGYWDTFLCGRIVRYKQRAAYAQGRRPQACCISFVGDERRERPALSPTAYVTGANFSPEGGPIHPAMINGHVVPSGTVVLPVQQQSQRYSA